MQTSIRLNRCKNGIDRSEVLIDRSVGSFFANVFEFGDGFLLLLSLDHVRICIDFDWWHCSG